MMARKLSLHRYTFHTNGTTLGDPALQTFGAGALGAAFGVARCVRTTRLILGAGDVAGRRRRLFWKVERLGVKTGVFQMGLQFLVQYRQALRTNLSKGLPFS